MEIFRKRKLYHTYSKPLCSITVSVFDEDYSTQKCLILQCIYSVIPERINVTYGAQNTQMWVALDSDSVSE